MLNKKENIFILKLGIILALLIYGLYFYKYIISIQEALTFFIGGIVFIKTLSDVIYESGNADVYKYDENKNQKLRYLALIMMGGLNILFILIIIFRIIRN